MRANLAAAAVVAGISGGVLIGANSVSAQTSGESLVERIATTFNLDSSEVQVVFDEAREEKQAERQANATEKLQEKVDDGTITEDQKTIIEEARAALREQLEELRPEDKSSLSDEEREALHDQMKELKDSMKQTLEDAGIDTSEFGERHGKRGGHGPRDI